jgi:hypothetical protein
MNWKRYAGIAGDDVFTIFTFDADEQTNQYGPRMLAGLSSEPIFVEVPAELEVIPGWTYNGESFVAPTE